MSEIRQCTCKHPYQDQLYGALQRVHTPGTKAWTCTVCGATTPRSGETSSKKEAKK